VPIRATAPRWKISSSKFFARGGRLDLIANLIGGYAASDAGSGDLVAYRACWDQKVATIVTATTACLRPMRARGYGRVVNVASTAALKVDKGAAGYGMANAALPRWTESLAEETKRQGITAHRVLPRIIANAENRAGPMPKADPSRWATAAEIAAVVVFLSTDEANGLTGELHSGDSAYVEIIGAAVRGARAR
jgi:NAD(P)-dependent dehydrogenase (short-subunit alcohol dehydrogenase family)